MDGPIRGILMAIRIVQLGSPRHAGEGTRIGTVRRPPRGVRKDRYAADNWYDVWLPELSPSEELVAKAHHATTEKDWAAFMRAYRSEPDARAARRALEGQQLLGRLLLRERGAVPSLRAEGIAPRARRKDRGLRLLALLPP